MKFLAEDPHTVGSNMKCRDRSREDYAISLRDEEWEVLDPIPESSGAPDVCKSAPEFDHELGLKDESLTAELFTASGGHLILGRAATAAVADTASGDGSQGNFDAEDVFSADFADHVATLAPELDLGLTNSDAGPAALLAHLSIFSRQTALAVLPVVGSRVDGGLVMRDPEGVLMRLRMAGVLIPVPADDERRLYQIPNLIAGHLRLEMTKRSDSSVRVTALIAALVDNLESAHLVDSQILHDALTLSRRFGQWQQLARVQESVGLPMFLIAPRAVCATFGHLPDQALTAVPSLAFLSALTDNVLARLTGGSSDEEIRSVVKQETRAGRMRAFFPGRLDLGRSGRTESSVHLETSVLDSGRADFISTVDRIVSLTRTERHAEAALIGLAWSSQKHGRWAQLVIRLLTAISFFHCSQFRRAVSILGEIEADAESGHVEGDFLLPAVTAWTALASVVSGDHERADRALSGLDEELHGSLLVEELVRPAAHVASALRALDRLDLKRAEKQLGNLSAYPENRSLWAYLPVIGRTIAILTASTESGLLFVNDDVEKYEDPSAMSATGRDLLTASRSMVFIGLGQLKWAEVELEKISQTSDARIVLKVRVELVAGRLESAVSLADTWFYHPTLTPAKRAELAAIKAAALLRLGREAEAVAEFVTAVGLSTWVSSALPVAMLPQADRNHLLDLTAGHEVWSAAFNVFSTGFRDCDEFVQRLRSVGSIVVDSAIMPQLSVGEAQLLDLLARGLSVSQISGELHQVTGTVKNRLSVLYRKFGVSNRSQVIERARSLGFLLP